MHELKELKETLCDELKDYARKGKMSAGDLEVVDKLTHTIKNLDKIIENYEGDYSEARGGRNYHIEGSYARRRDSMGRYSRAAGMIPELRHLMEEAPDEKTRREFERFIDKMETL